MGKNKKQSIATEETLLLPPHTLTSSSPIVDTHTHLLSTFQTYRSKYKQGQYETVYEFVRGMYKDRPVEAIVDVWCEAPVDKAWKELADSAEANDERWGGLKYNFVMGVHPHQAKLYDDQVETDILEAMKHPRCVGWGECGLDYHYDNSPRDIQQAVLIRQLKQAVRLRKALTIHTREAEEDTERILKEVVPKDHKIHIHCFTDSPDFAQRLLDHFPNLFIGITGVITYSTNLNTAELIKRLLPISPPPSGPLRILLETDAPYMIPSNIYASRTSPAPDATAIGVSKVKSKLPLSHSGMIPWTAQFIADLLSSKSKSVSRSGDGGSDGAESIVWTTEHVMDVARENARFVYGV